jgi:tetratricopeptide (TPR) repeat protein
MSWVDYFLDKERMLLDCLLELQAGEMSHYSVAESRGLGSLGFGFMTYDLRRIARMYHTRAAPLARDTNNPSAIAFAWFSLGFLDFYDGRWDDSESNLRKGAVTYRDSGDIRRWGGAILMLSFITSRRGKLEETRTLAADLAGAGRDAADPQLTSWGLQVQAYAELETGPLDEAIANMRRGVALASKIHAWDNFLYPSSLLCKALVYQGRLEEAVAVLEEAQGVMKATHLSRPFDQVELLTGSATVKLAIVEQSEGVTRDKAVREARTACRKALRCARVQPYWLPQGLRLQGTACWLAGKRKAAHKHWKESLKAADNSGFPLERARTLMELGERVGDIEALEQAAVVFKENGARVFLALTLHRLARVRKLNSTLSDRVVPDYEKALSALEAVNAEHDFERASQELERLRNSKR